MENFEKAFEKVMHFEAGYSNKKSDRGGETIFGISRVYNSSWLGWKLVDSLKKNNDFLVEINTHKELFALAKDYYRMHYYKTRYLDIDAFKNEKIAIELFDISVNMGVKTASMFLQEGLNLLNRNERLFKDLKIDGFSGVKTLKAYKKIRPDILLKVLNGLQFERYKKIVLKKPAQKINFAGWMKRV